MRYDPQTGEYLHTTSEVIWGGIFGTIIGTPLALLLLWVWTLLFG